MSRLEKVIIPTRQVSQKRLHYSRLEHIARSRLGRDFLDGLFSMWTSYSDDSRQKGFIVIAGWIAPCVEWEAFEINWKIFLASYKVPYLHMKEFAHSRGPYAKWENAPKFRARFMHDAWDVIEKHVRGGFVSLVQDILFNRVNHFYELEEIVPNAYALAGRACMEWTEQYAAQEKEPGRSVFDDPGSGDKCALIRVADLTPKVPAPNFEPSHDIPHRKEGIRRGLVQLQAADFLAYEVRKYAVDHALIRSGQRTPRFSLAMLGQKQPETCFFTEERLICMCKNLGLRRRNS